MSKYVARYTPIEGVPKEGDWYLSKFRQENKFFHYAQWKSNDTWYFIHTMKEDFVTKVELQLYEEDTPIGKISSRAKWVEHNDKFEEDEVKYNKTMTMRGQKEEDAFYFLIKCKCCGTFT